MTIRHIPIEDARYAAQRINEINAKRTARAESAAGFVAVLVIGILAALALVHFLTPCEGATLCMAAVITPTRSGAARGFMRMLERWQVRMSLADAELTLDRVQTDIATLPMVEDALLRDIDKLLTEETGLPVIIAEDPLTCVARGGGRILELMDELGPGNFGLE